MYGPLDFYQKLFVLCEANRHVGLLRFAWRLYRFGKAYFKHGP